MRLEAHQASVAFWKLDEETFSWRREKSVVSKAAKMLGKMKTENCLLCSTAYGSLGSLTRVSW